MEPEEKDHSRDACDTAYVMFDESRDEFPADDDA